MKTPYFFRFEKNVAAKLGLIIIVLLVSVRVSLGQTLDVNGYDASTGGFANSNLKEPSSLPTGSIIAMASEAKPYGYILCDGRSVTKTEFSDLFNVIGYTYGGSGDNFNVPDLRGVFLRGWSHTETTNDIDRGLRTAPGGVAVGNKVGSYQGDAFQSHNHTLSNVPNHVHSMKDIAIEGGSNAGASGSGVNDAVKTTKNTEPAGAHTHTVGNNGGSNYETRPKNIYVAYWIKATYTVNIAGNIQMQGGMLSNWAGLYLVADRDNNASGEDIIFGFNSNTVSTVQEKMRLKESGNLGIGTNSPGEKLHVVGKGRFEQGITIGSSTTLANITLTGNNIVIDKGLTIGSSTQPASLALTGAATIAGATNITGATTIGTATTPSRLRLFGTAEVKELHIDPTTTWPDYVFGKDYELRPLAEVEAFITANKHLPEVPSAAEVSQQGYNQSEINATLLKKIEELTLYMIALEKKNEALNQEVLKLKSGK